uniref:Uncharacterized protein n=1 Tax=Arundo donax TaxID=35708 RepID=A0A0A9Q0Y0_ARUDO
MQDKNKGHVCMCLGFKIEQRTCLHGCMCSGFKPGISTVR